MNILTVYDVFSGCSWYRAVIPGHAAVRVGGHEVRVGAGETSPEHVAWADVIQLQRLWHPNAIRMVRYARSLGKRTVYDIDDDVWAIEKANPAHAFWVEKDHASRALDVLKECDSVTTTGPDLANTLRRHHKDVRIIPNALGDDFRRVRKSDAGKLIVGWAGGNSHTPDIKLIERVILDIVNERDVTVAIAVGGEWIEHERVMHVPPVAIENYHAVLSTFDIGMAPLLDSRFNRAKSDLKPLEYAGVGVPFVASRVGPYRTLTRGGLTAPTPKEFKRHLLRLIDDEPERRRMAADGLEWAESRRISAILPLWESVWRG